MIDPLHLEARLKQVSTASAGLVSAEDVGAAAFATVGCVNSTCVIASCNAGRANCDADYANGCETDTQVSAKSSDGTQRAATEKAVQLSGEGAGYMASSYPTPADGSVVWVKKGSDVIWVAGVSSP